MRNSKLTLIQNRLRFQGSWRKLNGVKSARTTMSSGSNPDLVILYSGDAEEWDHYLSECFIQTTQPHTICIEHQRIENVALPSIPSGQLHCFISAKVVLLILSPDFLDYVDNHADVYELGKLFKPAHTLAMLCGVEEEDVTRIHKAALVSYDSWPRLVAKDQDKEFVLSVIHKTMDMLQRARDGQNARKPQFKLSPRKVREGNSKVFVILNHPVGEKQKIQILLEGDGVKEVPSKWRNPYTLQFVVPDNCLQVSRILNVHVLCDDMLFGVRQLKCESKIGELYTLLTSVNSPYEFLCQTMGVASLHEVDEELVRRFRQNVPPVGFSLLDSTYKTSRKKSEEELPTLLHFSARYGLQELTSQLLQCPNATEAVKLRNAHGLTPAQLANRAGHNDIAAMLDDYHNLCNANEWKGKPDDGETDSFDAGNNEHYKQVPFPMPIKSPMKRSDSESSTSGGEYLKMTSFRKLGNLDVFNGEECPVICISDTEETSNISQSHEAGDDIEDRQGAQAEEPLMNLTDDFSGSQTELIAILKEFKKGASITDVESMFREWQKRHRDSESETQLEELRLMYRQSQSNSSSQKKKMSRKQPFSFSELRNYISQKLNIKDTSSSKSPSQSEVGADSQHLASPTCGRGQSVFRPVSVVSIASVGSSSSSGSTDRFSTFSAASSCDSGNHSDSCDEGNRFKDICRETLRNDPKSVYSVPPSKTIRVSQYALLAERPPAPPPRPTRISLNVSSNKDALSDHGYYKYPPMRRNSSPEYVSPDADAYLMSSQVDAAIKALEEASNKEDENTSNDPNEGARPNSEHYQRPPSRPVCVSSVCKLKTSKPIVRGMHKPPKYQHVIQHLQKDALSSYDFVPMPPVPVNGRGTPQNETSIIAAADYDIPRPLYQVPKGSKKAQNKYL